VSRNIDGIAIETLERQLLDAIKANLPDLVSLLDHARSTWVYEDFVYRFYHGSFKVYGVQLTTLHIVEKLRGLLPDVPLNDRFLRIVANGTGKVFNPDSNPSWEANTRPLLEAFFHARYFLEMAVKYGAELPEPPSTLPSGWAGPLYLYNLR
jgi:hypothetical protein